MPCYPVELAGTGSTVTIAYQIIQYTFDPNVQITVQALSFDSTGYELCVTDAASQGNVSLYLEMQSALIRGSESPGLKYQMIVRETFEVIAGDVC